MADRRRRRRPGTRPIRATGGTVRPHPEQGSGVLALSFGVLFFLGFLLLATQIAFGLYARSVVGNAALDAGRIVAHAPGPDGVLQPGELAASRRAAEQRVRDLLGDAATFELDTFEPASNEVTVSVTAPRPRLLLGGGTIGPAVVQRRVSLRLELLQ